MKKLLTLSLLGACLAGGAAHAADTPPTAQQNKMASCNKEAGAMKGDERKAFMKNCLSAAPAKATTQQDRMKSCNASPKARSLKGDERKAFMKSCLSGAPA